MTYLPIDPERFGDGQDDCLPGSTGLHNRIWDNTKELAVEPRMLCWSPIINQADITSGATSAQGVRPYAMLGAWLSILRTRIHVPRGAKKLVIWGAHHVLTPTIVTDTESALTITFDAGAKTAVRSVGTWTLDGLVAGSKITFSGTTSNNTTFTYVSGVGTNTLTFEEAPTTEGPTGTVSVQVLHVVGTVSVRVRLEGRSDQSVTLEQTRTGSVGTPTVAMDKIEVMLDDRTLSGDAVLDIAIKSTLGNQQFGTLGTTSQAAMSGYVIQDSDTAPVFFANSTSGNPDADSLEVMAVGVKPSSDALQWRDMVGAVDHTGKGGTHGSEAYVTTELPFWPGNTEAATLQEICYIAPRSIAIQIVCDRESVGRIDRAELRPNIELSGFPSGKQVEAVRSLLLRPRLASLGPEGTLKTSDPGFTGVGYRRGWPTVRGHNGEVALWSQVVSLTTPNPLLALRQWVAALSLSTIGNSETAFADKSKNTWSDTPGRAAWAFRLVVDQINDVPGGGATWAANTTQHGETDIERVLQLTPTDRNAPNVPLLGRSMEHAYQELGGYDGLAYKEGAVCLELGDGQVIQPITIQVDLTGVDEATAELPLRATLYAEHDAANSANDYMRLEPDGDHASWLQLVCGQNSITEAPTPTAMLAGVRPEMFLPRAFIRQSDWAKLSERLDYHWKRTGMSMPGRVYDPPFQTNDTNWTVVNDAAGPDLDSWAGLGVFQRLENGNYVLRVQAFIQDLDVRITLTRWDDRTTHGVFTTELTLSSSSGASEWVEGYLTVAQADAHQSGNTSNPLAAFYATIDAKHNGAGNGYMWVTPTSTERPAPPAPSFGTTATFLQKTNYFSGAGQEVWAMSGRGLTDQCAIGRRLSSANNDGLKLITSSGGTSWTADNSAISAAGQGCYGLFTNSDYVWWCFDGNSGGRAVAQRVGVSDGVVDWTSNTGTGSPTAGLGRTIALDVANDDLVVLWNDSGDEVQAIDATSGTLGNDTDDSSITTSQGACATCVTGDGSLLLVAGDNERVEYHSTPLANGSAGSGTLNFASGSSDVTNTTSGFSAFHNADTPEPTLTEDRTGDGAWLSGGRYTNQNDPYLWHIDPTTPSVDIEKNVTSDWGISTNTYNYVMDHCQDKYGDVWALCTNGILGTDACDVVRYRADGTFVQSFASDSVSNLPTGIARTITIDDSGNLYIGDKNGDVSVWAMS